MAGKGVKSAAAAPGTSGSRPRGDRDGGERRVSSSEKDEFCNLRLIEMKSGQEMKNPPENYFPVTKGRFNIYFSICFPVYLQTERRKAAERDFGEIHLGIAAT